MSISQSGFVFYMSTMQYEEEKFKRRTKCKAAGVCEWAAGYWCARSTPAPWQSPASSRGRKPEIEFLTAFTSFLLGSFGVLYNTHTHTHTHTANSQEYLHTSTLNSPLAIRENFLKSPWRWQNSVSHTHTHTHTHTVASPPGCWLRSTFSYDRP